MVVLTEKREIERLRSLIESAAKWRFKKVAFFVEGVRACIFRAEEAKTKCTVAIKILKKNQGDIAYEAFKTAALSDHPHIVRAYDLLRYHRMGRFPEKRSQISAEIESSGAVSLSASVSNHAGTDGRLFRRGYMVWGN